MRSIYIFLRKLFYPIIMQFRVASLNLKWRKGNPNNFTTVENVFPLSKAKVGKGTYGPLNVKCYGNPLEKLVIGNFCSIAPGVIFILGGEHNYNCVSTYPYNYFYGDKHIATKTKGPICVEDDVWIGENAIILSGCKIGRGSVIGAGSIVSTDIPEYSIYAGNRILKRRFNEDEIKMLKKIDYQVLDINLMMKLEENKFSVVDIRDLVNSSIG